MKLRIRGDSIRLRLTRGEVDKLQSEGRVEESLSFGDNGNRFTYTLETSAGGGEPRADMDGGELCIKVPKAIVREWAATEAIGFESSPGSVPRILVEKDFACLTARPGEDESDMYQNPDASVCGAG